MQVTYSHTDRKVSLDQADIRYARPAKVGNTDFIWGIDFNNNPTLQDPFNSFGAFAYPYITSTLAPGLSATPLIVGGLSHQVAGISTYIFINSNIYAELGGYTSLGHGFLHDFGIDDSAGKLAGVAPYWRLAYVKDWEGQSASLGLVGMRARLHPGRQAGPTDKYDDFGFDGTYQYIGDGKNVFSLNTAYIFETQNLDFAIFNGDTDRRRHELNQFTADASWYYKGSYGLTLGLFSTTGSLDTNLLTSAPDSGSRVGRPDTDGYRLEANWVPFGDESSWGAPWANLRLGVQFTGYLKFNGAKYDYDGFGRKASDNNTTYVYTWFAF